MICGYLACNAYATHQLIPDYGRTWYRCEEHLPHAVSAFKDAKVEKL